MFASGLIESAGRARSRVTYQKAKSDSTGRAHRGRRGYGAYLGHDPRLHADRGRRAPLRRARRRRRPPGAGIQGGDVIVRFDGIRVDNIYDYTYRAPLAQARPGGAASRSCAAGRRWRSRRPSGGGRERLRFRSACWCSAPAWALATVGGAAADATSGDSRRGTRREPRSPRGGRVDMPDPARRGALRRPLAAHVRRRERRGVLVARRHTPDLPVDARRVAVRPEVRARPDERRDDGASAPARAARRAATSTTTTAHRCSPRPTSAATRARRSPIMIARATSGRSTAELRHLHGDARRHRPDGASPTTPATTPRPRSRPTATASCSPRCATATSTSTRMAPDGTDVTRLTNEPGYDGGAFFSRDGKRIVWRPATEATPTAARRLPGAAGAGPGASRRAMDLWVMRAGRHRQARRSRDKPGASFAPVLHARRQAHHLLLELGRPARPQLRPLPGRRDGRRAGRR